MVVIVQKFPLQLPFSKKKVTPQVVIPRRKKRSLG